MIYLDNAATTLKKPPEVARAVLTAMETAGNSARGAHPGSLNAARILYEAREKTAKLLDCPRPDHVVFTCNATESLNMTICGLLRPGDHVITTELEHNSVLRPLYRLQQEQGVSVDFLPTDDYGNPEYDRLGALLRPDTKALIFTHASNLTGNLTDPEAMKDFAVKHGLLTVMDASQTAGTCPVSCRGLDAVCFTGHKGLLAPQGTGGLCVRPGVEIRPWKVGGSGVQSHSLTQPEQMPERLEAGTLNAHGIAGLSAALDVILSLGVEEIHRKERELTERFYQGVRDLPGVKVYGDFRGDHAAIVSLNIGDMDSGEAADRLYREYDIAVRSGIHCAPRMHRALGTEKQGAVRFSFSLYTTGEETDDAVRAVAALAREVCR